MWELDCKESWVPKNWCFWTVVLEKTLESPLDSKDIQPVHSKGGQPWVFFGRNDAKAETPVLWPPHATSWLIGKDPDAGRDWGQEEKGKTEDEMAGWHHWLDGREFEWTPGGDGQGGLACCNSWGRKESETTERLNWTLIQVSSVSFLNLIAHFFLFLNNILLYWCTIVCLSIQLWSYILVVSNLCVCVCVRERELELSCYINHMHVFVWVLAFKSFAKLSRHINAKTYAMAMFSYVRNFFQSDCVILHPL